MLAIDRNYESCDSGKRFFSALAIPRNESPAIVRIFTPPCLQIRIQLWLLSIHIKEFRNFETFWEGEEKIENWSLETFQWISSRNQSLSHLAASALTRIHVDIHPNGVSLTKSPITFVIIYSYVWFLYFRAHRGRMRYQFENIPYQSSIDNLLSFQDPKPL